MEDWMKLADSELFGTVIVPEDFSEILRKVRISHQTQKNAYVSD